MLLRVTGRAGFRQALRRRPLSGSEFSTLAGSICVADEQLVVCLGFTVFHEERYVQRLRDLPGVEPLILPIDPQGSWNGYDSRIPHPEPPPWATSVAAERRMVLDRAHVLIALHSTEDLLGQMPELRWIQGIGAGMEQFPRAGVARDRVIVTNASGVSAGSMAEWTVGRLLQVWKNFRADDENQRKHEFRRNHGRTFAGSTIGIVGLGNIGVAVAQRVRALGCRVLGSKRSAVPGATSEHADVLYGPGQLHEMMHECDAVVAAAPAIRQTRHLIDAAALAAMRPDAVLVNVARRPIVGRRAGIGSRHAPRCTARRHPRRLRARAAPRGEPSLGSARCVRLGALVDRHRPLHGRRLRSRVRQCAALPGR